VDKFIAVSKNIVLLGPPGSGKGTYSSLLAEKYNFVHISTGDIIREEIKNRTRVGIIAEKYISNGLLVPDDIIIEIIKNTIKLHNINIVFDGFPRNIAQAEALEKFCKTHLVINIDISEDDSIKRLTTRIMCSNCKRVYNIITQKPKVENICNNCNCKLELRCDDREDVIRERFKVYVENTLPLINYYKRKNILRTISGKGSVEVVMKKIIDEIFCSK